MREREADGEVTELLLDGFLKERYRPNAGLATMAALAANIYGPDDPASCAGPDGLIPLPPNWQRLSGEFSPVVEGSEISGFGYEHWINYTSLEERVTVTVFMGTEGPGDWCNNLRHLGCSRGFDQYEQALKAAIHTANRAYDDLGGPDTYPAAVGHSLGGALAELAGLVHDRVYPVYSFDPSPVLGHDVLERLEIEPEGSGFGIVRVFEHGEVLAFVRYFKRLLLSKSPLEEGISEYRLNLLGGNPLRQHSMKDLACELRERELAMLAVDTSVQSSGR